VRPAEQIAVEPAAVGATGSARGPVTPPVVACSEPGRLYDAVIRLLDILVSLAVLIVASPLMLVIAILVKRSSPGPILFRQERIGRNRRSSRATGRVGAAERRREDRFGEPFVLYKFRSMYSDSRERFPELYAYDHSPEEMRTLPIKILVGRKCAPKELVNPDKLNGHLLGDPRITPLGVWLRRTSFDEFPNFFNVLKGDMHLVGPRPDIAENIRYYSDRHMCKLDVKPGITDLAQVSARRKLSVDETNEYDVRYLESRSILFDLKILFRTLLVCLKRDGAF
jgi:lipopolysaccharide/colanic/teichoic acid biosynthesis glycosyltransferase